MRRSRQRLCRPSAHRSINQSSFRVSRGQFVLLRGKLCSSSHVGFHALLCDVTALAWSWTSPDGWLRGERPADRRALEGAVVKAGSVASRSSREFRDSRDVQREHTHTGTSFLTVRFLDIAHRRLVQSERRYGAEPRPCPSFLGLMST